MSFLAAAVLALAAQGAPVGVSDAAAERPNVVLILVDDAGWGDLGCYGQRKFRTPSLDRMAAEGLRFTQFYSGAAVCVPARCVLMTGKHTGHAAIRVNAMVPLPAEETTLAEILQDAGYRTACIGKWALGRSPRSGSPREQGFDTYFGYIDQVQAHRHYPPFLLRDDARVPLEGNPETRTHYSHDLFTDEALRFLAEAREEPFFLYLAYSLPHADIDVPEDSRAPYAALGWPETPYVESGVGRGRERTYSDQPTPRATFAGMMSRIDRDVGRLLAKLDELGLDERTLVLFTSDNGPSDEGGVDRDFFDSNGPFRGGKGELHEGGIRVPLLARWPGRIAPGTSALACAAWDLLPTLAELAGTAAPAEIDGVSLVPTLLGRPAEQAPHAYLYWEHIAPGPFASQALRQGDWKALRLGVQGRNPRLELYDLAADPGETRDLAAEQAERAAEMARLMDEAHEPSAMSPLTHRELRGGRPERPR